MKTFAILIISLLVSGCATVDIQKHAFKAQKVVRHGTGCMPTESLPEVAIFGSVSEIRKIAERFSGKKFKGLAFYHPSSKTIFIYKWAATKIVIHELLHFYLTELFPNMTYNKQHILITKWGY